MSQRDFSCDETVNKIMEQIVPAFADADLRQAVAAVVALFTMAIHVRPPSERNDIVRQASAYILDMATNMAGDAGSEEGDDLATRQQQAQLRMLYVLREFNLSKPEEISPVVAAITASLLLQFPPENRSEAARTLRRYTKLFLNTEPAGMGPSP